MPLTSQSSPLDCPGPCAQDFDRHRCLLSKEASSGAGGVGVRAWARVARDVERYAARREWRARCARDGERCTCDGAPCAGWDGYIGGRGCCGSPRNAQGSSGLVCVRLERLCMPTAGYSEFRNIPTRKCEYSMRWDLVNTCIACPRPWSLTSMTFDPSTTLILLVCNIVRIPFPFMFVLSY